MDLVVDLYKFQKQNILPIIVVP